MRQPVALRVPPSKSETHRALLLAALSETPCRVTHPLLGADCRSTLACLRGLGARFTVEDAAVSFRPVDGLVPPEGPLDCGNSGTTLRLLTAQAARICGPVTLTGDASLQGRPNGPLLDALAAGGVAVHSPDGTAPLTVSGPLRPGGFALPPRVSSQYATGLLLALCLLDGDSTLSMAGPVSSRPYLDITAQVAARFGLRWTTEERGEGLVFDVPGRQVPRARAVAVAGDWSTAAFPLVAGVLTQRETRLAGLLPDSPQGDRAVVQHLRAFGQEVAWQGADLGLRPTPPASPGRLDLGATPDLFPALCALAAVTPGRTELSGAPSLRHKESDRIARMAAGLAALGRPVEELPDGLVIEGGPLGSADIDSEADHRVYMAFRLLSLVAAGPLRVSDAGCEAVSYPGFEAALEAFEA